MYSMKRDTYTCDLCGVEMKWDESDEINGEMWGCEKCGDTFCSKCFIDKYGREAYMSMMQGHDKIYCPNCFQKITKV